MFTDENFDVIAHKVNKQVLKIPPNDFKSLTREKKNFKMFLGEPEKYCLWIFAAPFVAPQWQ